MVVAREPRGTFGRWVKRGFFGFQALMLVGSLGTCAVVGRFVTVPDPEVAMGAGMFGAMALGTIWLAWPVGTLVLGVLLLLTRGRKRLVALPPG